MATPSSHANDAAALLAAATAFGDDASLRRNAQLAGVYAVLAGKAGTGSNYTSAETELATCTTAPWSFGSSIERARAFALLAT